MKKFLTKNVVYVSLIVIVLISIVLTSVWVYAHRTPPPRTQTDFVTRSGSQLLLHGQPYGPIHANLLTLFGTKCEHTICQG